MIFLEEEGKKKKGGGVILTPYYINEWAEIP
jgi:hypothetical protein